MGDEPLASENASSASGRSDGILDGILAISSEAIITVDASHRISSFSAGAEAIFGYTAAEILGHSLERLIPENLRDGHRSHVERFRQGEVRSRLMQDRGPIFGLRNNGEAFPIEASISKIETAAGVVFTAIVRDVTERRRAEDRLARSEQRLSLALRNSALHVFELDYRERTLSKAGAEDTFFERPLTYEDLAESPWCALAVDDRPGAKCRDAQ